MILEIDADNELEYRLLIIYHHYLRYHCPTELESRYFRRDTIMAPPLPRFFINRTYLIEGL